MSAGRSKSAAAASAAEAEDQLSAAVAFLGTDDHPEHLDMERVSRMMRQDAGGGWEARW
jgi:hypothetical protein